MSHARNHHYVSACYLKHFAVPQDRCEGRLHIYDRVTGRTFPSSPDKSAREKDFYAVEVEGESPALAEDAYAALEARFAPTIAGVIERGTLPKDPIPMRELLAFVATQAVRTPRVREMQASFYSDVGMGIMEVLAVNKDVFKKEHRDADPDITDAELEQMYADHCAFLTAKGARVEMDQTTLVGDALELAGELEDILACRCWILGVAPDGTSFVTSDDPVHLQPTGLAIPKNPLWSPGFGDPHTNVIVALSPRLLLMGRPDEFTARARVRFSRRKVAEINTDLALSAHRFVYSTGPRFAQIGEDGSVIEGPTETLRRREDPRPRSPLGGFPGTA